MVFDKAAMMVPTEPSCAAEEEKVLCVVRDLTNPDCHTKQTFNLPAIWECRKLLSEVAQRLGYVENSFILSYEQPSGEILEEVIINDNADMRLEEVVVNSGNGKINTFSVLDKDGMLPVKVESLKTGSDNSPDGAESTIDTLNTPSSHLRVGLTSPPEAPDLVYRASTYGSSPSTGTSSTTTSTSYGYSYSSSLIKSDTGFVGLVNQAMTCYLNSLLQTLFMTPEFRNAVYRWEFDGTEEEASKSIPYQLQKLFVQLQTSKKRAVETTDITKSFGWDSSEVWQQHDVQELCRVMFDALEKKWRNTDQADLINQLYQGKMKDYVKCVECGHESARTDSYLDIPLVIKPFGSNITHESVDQALNAFVEPEILDDTNKYYCEKCDKKCVAHKGLKFQSFPYLLTLQLKRFDFDYVSLHRIKLNDKLTFPEILDLNHLIEGSQSEEAICSRLSEVNCSDASGVKVTENCNDLSSEVKVAENSNSSGAASSPCHVACNGEENEGIDEGIDIGYSASGTSAANSDVSSVSSTEAATNDRNIKDSKAKGPYEYELFSIMIHSGSAAGGHYYAYIKSFQDGQWYSFNDQHVSTITYDDIKKTYGGSSSTRGYYSSAYTSSTNAYMLMYRRIDVERNREFYKESEFPQHLKDALSRIKEREEADRLQRELDRHICKIRLFCFHPEHSKLLESRLEIHKDKTLKEATEIAWRQFELEKLVNLDCVRLVKYDETLDYIDQSYDDKQEASISQILGGVKSFYAFELLLELKAPDQIFLEYKPGGVTVKVHTVDLTSETISPPLTVQAYLTQTIGEFKGLLSQVLKVPSEVVRCVRERYYNDLRLLVTPGRTLKAEGFSKTNKVFVEFSGTEDDSSLPFVETKLYRLLDRYENTIRLHVILPAQSQGADGCHGDHAESPDKDPASESSHKSVSDSVDRPASDVDEGIDETDSTNRTSGVPVSGGQLVSEDPWGGGDGAQVVSSERSDADQAQLAGGEDAQSSERSEPDGEESSTSGVSTVIYPMDTVGEPQSDAPSPLHTSVQSSPQNLSPDESTPTVVKETESRDVSVSWDLDDPVTTTEWERSIDDEYRRYFTAQLHVNTETGEKGMTAYVDKRITLGSLKKELEQYVGATSDYFKIYRVYSNSQEVEVTRLSETLSTYSDDSKLAVKMGRALKKGEYRVKVYQLQVNTEEMSKFLVEVIFSRGMTVYESKKIVQTELRTQCDMDIALDRFRLRKKSWKNPSKIYQDNQVYDRDVTIMTNWELFLEILDGPDPVTSISQLQLYVRRWWPSLYKLDVFQEIVLNEQTLDELKQEISDISGIPVEDVEFAKARGTFPCEGSILDIHSEMDWNVPVSSLNMYPLSVCEDGAVLYYRDKTEKLVELTGTKKKELQQKENSRMSLYTCKTYSPRKERALKIYTDDSPGSSPTSLAPNRQA